MTILLARDQRIIALLEDAICTKEMSLTWKLAGGLDTLVEQVAIRGLYRTLRVARHCQAHQTKQPSAWLMHFP